MTELEALEKVLEDNVTRMEELKNFIRQLQEEVKELEMKKNAQCGDKLTVSSHVCCVEIDSSEP